MESRAVPMNTTRIELRIVRTVAFIVQKTVVAAEAHPRIL